jgi:CheY-like chemotaxis protein
MVATVSKRVLIADRDDDALTCLRNLLEEMGFNVVSAHSDAEALCLAERDWPDVAVLDIGSPQFEGLTAAHRLREMAANRPLLLIALTGWGQPQYRDMALAAGFDVHLVKPVGVDQLELILTMACA